METENTKDGDVSNAPKFKTHDDYIKLFTERRERIYKRTDKRNFIGLEYLDMIKEDELIMSGEKEEYTAQSKRDEETIKDNDSIPERPTTSNEEVVAVIVDPFTSEETAGTRPSNDEPNVCISCEG